MCNTFESYILSSFANLFCMCLNFEYFIHVYIYDILNSNTLSDAYNVKIFSIYSVVIYFSLWKPFNFMHSHLSFLIIIFCVARFQRNSLHIHILSYFCLCFNSTVSKNQTLYYCLQPFLIHFYAKLSNTTTTRTPKTNILVSTEY